MSANQEVINSIISLLDQHELTQLDYVELIKILQEKRVSNYVNKLTDTDILLVNKKSNTERIVTPVKLPNFSEWNLMKKVKSLGVTFHADIPTSNLRDGEYYILEDGPFKLKTMIEQPGKDFTPGVYLINKRNQELIMLIVNETVYLENPYSENNIKIGEIIFDLDNGKNAKKFCENYPTIKVMDYFPNRQKSAMSSID